jgi:hypothetical protein
MALFSYCHANVSGEYLNTNTCQRKVNSGLMLGVAPSVVVTNLTMNTWGMNEGAEPSYSTGVALGFYEFGPLSKKVIALHLIARRLVSSWGM